MRRPLHTHTARLPSPRSHTCATRSGTAFSSASFSSAESGPSSCTFSTPLGPNVTGAAKKGAWIDVYVCGQVHATAGGISGFLAYLGEAVLDEGALHHALLPRQRLEHRRGEKVPSIGHGEGGGPGAVLGLDHLVAAELDAVRQLPQGLVRELGALHLREQREDGRARVPPHDRHVGGRGVPALRQEGKGKGTEEERRRGVHG